MSYDLFRHSLKIYRFSLLFFYKVTTTAAQFAFYNGKWQFTTAEIVSRYTLKYALANYGALAGARALSSFGNSMHSAAVAAKL